MSSLKLSIRLRPTNRRLLVAGYKASEIRSLFEFVNWLMPLPVDMEKRYVTEVKKGSGGNKMEKLLSNYDKMVISEKTWEMAKRMLNKGMDVKTIAEVTNLSEDEIKEVANRPTKEAA
jgi:hypothetical protein